MDKRTIIGIFLIAAIILLLPYYMRWIAGDQPVPSPTDEKTYQTQPLDTSVVSTEIATARPDSVSTPPPAGVAEQPESIAEALPSRIQSAPEIRTFQIETKFVHATLSNENGGRLTKWELKNYDYYLGGKVDLTTHENGLNIDLTNRNGKQIQLVEYQLFTDIPDQSAFILDEHNPVATIELYLPIEGGRLVKQYVFHYDHYSVDVIVKLEQLQNYIVNRRYFLSWERGLSSTEENIKEDYDYARAYAYMAGELETLDVGDEETVKEEYTGRVDWTAVRTKYFVASIIPRSPATIQSVTLKGTGVKTGGHLVKYYSTTLEVPYSQGAGQADSFQVYLGPLDYGIVNQYEVDLETLVMNKDWYERIFRPISLIILPAFKFLHAIIPNFGWVIIIFSILIKLILHPLTKKSYQSMSEMQYVQPELTKLREKYKNEPQRMNKEMMRLYKEHGINPLGGCLPTLLQMPLLFALFIVFRSTIQLRGKPFILWIEDLSRPDTLHLGFSLPFIGDSIHVLPFLMGLTMIWQSRMTMTDPKQKAMVYIMPVFITFIFYSLPSGLNLYYAVFNLLSMVQTRLIKKKMHPAEQEKSDQEPLRGSPAPKKPAPVRSRPGKKGRSKRKSK